MARSTVTAHDLAGMTKKERKAYQRELNRFEREERARRARSRRRILIGLGLLAVACVLAGAGAVVYQNVAAGAVGPANMLSDGVRFTTTGTTSTASSNTISVEQTGGIAAWGSPVANDTGFESTQKLTSQLYVDYTSADAATFWTTNSSTIGSWIASAYLTLDLHPIALDQSDEYAVRAVAAFGCVAAGDSAKAWDVNAALLAAAATAAEGGSALSVDALPSLIENAGVSDAAVLACVSNGTYRNWAVAASSRAATASLYAPSTAITKVPTFVSAGLVYSGAVDDSSALTSFISTDAVSAALASESASASPSASAPASGSEPASASPSASSSNAAGR